MERDWEVYGQPTDHKVRYNDRRNLEDGGRGRVMEIGSSVVVVGGNRIPLQENWMKEIKEREIKI